MRDAETARLDVFYIILHQYSIVLLPKKSKKNLKNMEIFKSSELVSIYSKPFCAFANEGYSSITLMGTWFPSLLYLTLNVRELS